MKKKSKRVLINSRRFLFAIIVIGFFIFSGSIFLSGCGGGGGNNSSTSPTANPSNLTVSISGTVSGGIGPLNGAKVSLYEISDNSILVSTITNSNGNYSLNYSYPNSAGPAPAFYVIAAGVSTNSYTLVNLYAGNPTVNINELTTAETTYALNEAGGSIDNDLITVNNSANLVSDYNAVLSNPTVNNNEISYIADSLAYCLNSINSCYMTTAFSNSALSYSQGSGYFTLLAVQNYNSSNAQTAADIQTAAYGSYYGFYRDNGSQAPFQITNFTAASAANTINVYLDEYSDESAPNIPYITIYINNQPINLLFDTGATGIMINQSALTASGITLPMSNFNFSGQFGDGGAYSGYISYANITAGSGGLTAQNIPIAVATTDTDFPSAGFIQGDFGMGLSPYDSFGTNHSSGYTIIYTPSIITALPSNYSAGFILNFNNISFTNGYNNAINSSTPAGILTYGLNTTVNNTVPSGSNFYPAASTQILGYSPSVPYIQSKLGASSSDSTGYQFYSFFDTGSNFIYLGTDALDDAVNNTASTNDVYSCAGLNLVYGGLLVSFSLQNNLGVYNTNNFTTEPVGSYNNFCDYNVFNSAAGGSIGINNAVVYGGSQQGQEDIGLPFMFNQPVYWQAQSPNSSWGIGIEP
ncbi:MAG: aspartyl protease family protein [bacterium]